MAVVAQINRCGGWNTLLMGDIQLPKGVTGI